jgi:hypothetical protein
LDQVASSIAGSSIRLAWTRSSNSAVVAARWESCRARSTWIASLSAARRRRALRRSPRPARRARPGGGRGGAAQCGHRRVRAAADDRVAATVIGPDLSAAPRFMQRATDRGRLAILVVGSPRRAAVVPRRTPAAGTCSDIGHPSRSADGRDCRRTGPALPLCSVPCGCRRPRRSDVISGQGLWRSPPPRKSPRRRQALNAGDTVDRFARRDCT